MLEREILLGTVTFKNPVTYPSHNEYRRDTPGGRCTTAGKKKEKKRKSMYYVHRFTDDVVDVSRDRVL